MTHMIGFYYYYYYSYDRPACHSEEHTSSGPPACEHWQSATLKLRKQKANQVGGVALAKTEDLPRPQTPYCLRFSCHPVSTGAAEQRQRSPYRVWTERTGGEGVTTSVCGATSIKGKRGTSQVVDGGGGETTLMAHTSQPTPHASALHRMRQGAGGRPHVSVHAVRATH